MFADWFLLLITISAFLNFFLLLIMVFLEKRKPQTIIAWITILTFVPIVGFILYVIFGSGLSRRVRQMIKKKAISERDIIRNINGIQTLEEAKLDGILKNDVELVSLVEIISSSIGSLSNPKKLSDTFKSTAGLNIDPKTVSLYLKYLEEAFLIEKVERYDVKGKKYMNTPYKFYFSDLGLRNSFINFRQYEETHIMENVIYLELRRRGYNVDVGIVEFRERKENELTYKQLEIDFIANKGNNKIYIQSAFSMPNEEKVNQEERPLLKVNDAFKKIIIVKDYIKRIRNENGIITMSIFDFLLDPDSLDY